ncbi:MAG TPA: SpoIID/LytB domain-containing protein [Bacillota bacterium]|nr:SpoIID/LytB domain-containing protein [Bacillota bacterium]
MRKKLLSGFILIAVLIIPFLSNAQTPDLVKIGLVWGQTEIQVPLGEKDQLINLSGNQAQPIQTQPNITSVFSVFGEGIAVNGTPVGKGPVQIVPGNTFLTWNNQNYRHELLVVLINGKLTLINQLPLEEYLRGVVPKEVPALWPMASLKAQAIAARTYSIATLGRHTADGFDLCATTHCHVYGGASAEKPTTDIAVAETAGKIIVYKGKVINAIYHSTSGGYTADPEKVWGVSEEYLKPVPDWDQSSPYSLWYRSIEWLDLQGAVARNYPQIGRLKQILPAAWGPQERIIKVCLKGDKGEVILTGEQFRFMVNLPSSYMHFAVTYGPEPLVTLWWLKNSAFPEAFASLKDLPGSPTEPISPPWDMPDPWAWLQDKTPLRVIVRGSGWGHRIGFSQWGAKGMAEAGYNENQILTYYYQGVSIIDAKDLK